MTSIALSSNDQWSPLELRKELKPARIEDEEVLSRVPTALALLPVPERVPDVTGLVQEENIRLTVPSKRIL
jgi:hypothetical protein